MNEFIEKLIDRLEELKSNEGFGGTIQKMYADAKIDDAIEIINELAEEQKAIMNYNTLLNDIKSQLKQFIADSNNIDYNRALVEAIEVIDKKTEEHKGGWIPCSEKLPEYDGGYICTAKECQESLELIYSTHDNSWMDEFDSEYEVIAWQPLPKKYNPKGE